MNTQFCMSFDIGGTYIKYAIIDNKGDIHLKDKIKTPGYPGNKTIPKVIIDTVLNFKNKFDIKCLGISTAGQVDIDQGKIIYATDNIPGYSGTDFTLAVSENLGLHIFVDNDVNCAALGEMWMGSGRGVSNFLCMTIGTGIGGAIVIDGKIYRGSSFSAGEIGHCVIIRDGAECTCGKKGCYESYASISALVKMYREQLVWNGLDVKENYSGEYIVDLYYKGDSIATKVYEEFLDYIAYGIANICEILDPQMVIIGGGISAQGERFFSEINNNFKKYITGVHSRNTKIIQASLLNDAGVLGAAFNIFSHIGVV